MIALMDENDEFANIVQDTSSGPSSVDEVICNSLHIDFVLSAM
jgi:hypothetical protein